MDLMAMMTSFLLSSSRQLMTISMERGVLFEEPSQSQSNRREGLRDTENSDSLASL